jgi:cytochrome c553
MNAKTTLRRLLFTLPWAFAAGVEVVYAVHEPLPDIAAGEEKAKLCVACHGERGISQRDNIPHLHGQRKTYLYRQMHTFRDGGDRRDPIMTPMLENMSDQDLENLAAYYSSFGTVLASETPAGDATLSMIMPNRTSSKPKGGEAAPAPAPALTGDPAAGQAKSATCAACHGADGRGTTPMFPNLNGQKAEYLAQQLRAFRDGKRQDATMAPMVTSLSDQDIADLAAYYAELK